MHIDVDNGYFYFVDSTTGNNGNAGTIAAPWRTIGYACSTADSSHYIYIRDGTYNQTAFTITGARCGRWLSYPGDSVRVIGDGLQIYTFRILSATSNGRYLFQGIYFDFTDVRHGFEIDAEQINGVIFRKCRMGGIDDGAFENPACVFFADGVHTMGSGHYLNVVFQENTFTDVDDPNAPGYGASVTMYDVQDGLFEDNLSYDIAGSGYSDKDNGYRNTCRNNIVHDCTFSGIGLGSQWGQGAIEVSHNLIYSCGVHEIWVSNQPGFIRDVFVHHNTVIGGHIYFSDIIGENLDECYNINVYNNIFDNSGSAIAYNVESHPGYQPWCNADSDQVMIDSNIVYSASTAVAGGDGLSNTSWAGWQGWNFDVNGIRGDPGLSSYKVPEESVYYGIYGREYPASVVVVPQIRCIIYE
jgi:hypothetical protein